MPESFEPLNEPFSTADAELPLLTYEDEQLRVNYGLIPVFYFHYCSDPEPAQLTDFKGGLGILSGQRATRGLAHQHLHLLEETLIPAFGLGGRETVGDPGIRRIGVAHGLCGDAKAVGHALIPCLVRACSLNSSRPMVRPAFMSSMPWRIHHRRECAI
jgi:hypothetical protein